MEPLAVISAKSIWLLNMAELNPKGLRIVPNLTDALREFYDFDPQSEEIANTRASESPTGVKLRNGQFDTDEGSVRVNLEVYNDGIVAETSVSTEVTDRFITHAVDWATTTFGLRFDPTLIVNRLYGSEVVVRLGSVLSDGFAALGSFAALLSQNADAGSDKVFSPSGLTFATASGEQAFSIERRANTPLQANVFYSKAPLPTQNHLKMLEEFDRMIAVPQGVRRR